jgi:hypothetical protein
VQRPSEKHPAGASAQGPVDPIKSIRILFWNSHKHDLSIEVAILAKDLHVDVIALLEHNGDTKSTLHQLQHTVNPAFRIPNHLNPRFLVLSRAPSPEFEEVYFSSRFSVRRFAYQSGYALLAVIHGLDPVNYDIASRSSFASEMVRDLREVMEVNQTAKALIIGDFNLNPFDAVMNQAAGFNAMMTKSCTEKGARRFAGKDYDYFYNPMWSFLGDLSPGVPGSIYYRGNRGQYGWNMFDQALVHHSLASCLSDVKIINAHHGIPLANTRGLPNSKLSDHFPLLVTLTETIQ